MVESFPDTCRPRERQEVQELAHLQSQRRPEFWLDQWPEMAGIKLLRVIAALRLSVRAMTWPRVVDRAGELFSHLVTT
jgi:hypothetical protein